jgi:hypothetical protein
MESNFPLIVDARTHREILRTAEKMFLVALLTACHDMFNSPVHAPRPARLSVYAFFVATTLMVNWTGRFPGAWQQFRARWSGVPPPAPLEGRAFLEQGARLAWRGVVGFTSEALFVTCVPLFATFYEGHISPGFALLLAPVALGITLAVARVQWGLYKAIARELEKST